MSSPTRAASSRPRGFGGLRVVVLESRLASEAARLVEKAGGIVISAPSMRELPIEKNAAAQRFAESLLAGAYDVVVCMTGVGTRYLFSAMETKHERSELVAAMSRTSVVARGPKPIKALRELGVPVALAVPEPNTWREMLAAMEEAERGVTLEGARVAVQEYGVSNERFLTGLRERGATVDPVEVYRWGLPEDLRPLTDAIREIIARTADVLLVTSATQVHHLFQVARTEGCEAELRQALAETVVASVGPIASEAVAELGASVDFEPSRPKLGVLVSEAASAVPELLCRKREALRGAASRGVTVTGGVSRPRGNGDGGAARSESKLADSPFLRACRREPVPYTPVWLMRQAGRYMQEYREARAKVPFIELCKTPALAAETAVTAQRRIGADAAILFSDILLIVEPMGLDLEYVGGEGPSISRTVREGADVKRLREVDSHESLGFVFDAVKLTRRELPPDVPLIGFSGAPFTLASYIVEGGSSKNYLQTKSLMTRDEGAWNAMMSVIARSVAAYLRGQIDAGCQAVQLFDSWVGCLSPADYERFVLPHTRSALSEIPEGVPVIHFGTACAGLHDLMAGAGGTVLGVDHRVAIGPLFDRFPGQAIQGNLDPVTLFTDPAAIRAAAKRLLDEVGGRPGHVFNLGHGVLPGTPVDNVVALVNAVHELSAA